MIVIFYLAIGTYESILLYFFFCKISFQLQSRKWLIAAIIIKIVIQLIRNIYGLNTIVSVLVDFIIDLFVINYCYRSQWVAKDFLFKCALLGVYYTLAFTCDLLAISVWTSIGQINSVSQELVAALASKTLLTAMTALLFFSNKVFLKDDKKNASKIILLSYSSTPIWLIIFLMCIMPTMSFVYLQRETVKDLSIIAIVMLAVILLAVIVIRQIRTYELKDRLNSLNTQRFYSQMYINEIKRSNKDKEFIAHDIRHHLILLRSMVNSFPDSPQTNKLIDYLNGLEERYFYEQTYTGNINIDALISAKAEILKREGIELALSGILPEEIPGINPIDICNIVGNVIENAIESNLEIENNRYIRIDVSHRNNWFKFIVNNPVKEVRYNALEKIYQSKKTNFENEGIGLQSVKFAAKLYGGLAHTRFSDGVFTTSVVLPTITDQKDKEACDNLNGKEPL